MTLAGFRANQSSARKFRHNAPNQATRLHLRFSRAPATTCTAGIAGELSFVHAVKLLDTLERRKCSCSQIAVVQVRSLPLSRSVTNPSTGSRRGAH
jgi:hypothetical protein